MPEQIGNNQYGHTVVWPMQDCTEPLPKNVYAHLCANNTFTITKKINNAIAGEGFERFEAFEDPGDPDDPGESVSSLPFGNKSTLRVVVG